MTVPLSVHTGGTEVPVPPDFRWPGGRRIAVIFRLAFEAWSDDHWPGLSPMGNPLKPGFPDLNARGWAEYGYRCGIFRGLEVFARQRITGTFMVNGLLAERYPEIVRSIADAGHEVAAHSYAMDMMSIYMNEEEERRNIRRNVELLQRATGKRPVGWGNPRSTPSPNPARLLAEEGFEWHGDTLNDDLPYLVRFGPHSIVAISAANFLGLSEGFKAERDDSMRLVTFVPPSGGSSRVGLVRDGREVIDLTRAGTTPPFDAADMISLISAREKAVAWLREAPAKAREALPLDKVRLLAPIPRPRKNVFCVGWNYLEHFKEGEKTRAQKVDLPDHPAFFSKAATSVTGPYDAIPFDAKVSEKIDWEVELGVIIGPGGKDIAEADGMRHVFGYTVVNDVSARDLQRRHGGQWFKGKSLDGFCPMGPWIVTADEIPDPDNLRLITRVNGVVKQDSNTSYMYFKLPRIVAELSLGLTLEAGDIIATGTPAGIGNARTPPEFMKAGDVMETEIVGLGLLRNRIGG